MHTRQTASLLASAILLASAAGSIAQERGREATPTQAQSNPAQANPARGDPTQAQRPAQAGAAQQGRMNPAQVEQMTRDWPKASRDAIKFMTDKYGGPASVAAGMAAWGETGPWKRTIVYREEVPHNFPMPHPDVMQQWINYEAPLERYDELAKYDGSVMLERTTGMMSARCDKEAANFLALNLADEVATGKRTVEDARMEYGNQIKSLKAGKTSQYTSGLMFSPPAATQARDSDEALEMMQGTNQKQAKKLDQGG